LYQHFAPLQLAAQAIDRSTKRPPAKALAIADTSD